VRTSEDIVVSVSLNGAVKIYLFDAKFNVNISNFLFKQGLFSKNRKYFLVVNLVSF
jgi:hypothetical protein